MCRDDVLATEKETEDNNASMFVIIVNISN